MQQKVYACTKSSLQQQRSISVLIEHIILIHYRLIVYNMFYILLEYFRRDKTKKKNHLCLTCDLAVLSGTIKIYCLYRYIHI